MATDNKHKGLITNITTWAQKPQFSIALPLAGLTAGEIAYLLRRKNLSPEERGKAHFQDLLLGGLAGTGLELARWGTAGFVDHSQSNNSIPKNLEGVALNTRKDG